MKNSVLILSLLSAMAVAPAMAASCAELTSTALSDTTFNSVQVVAAGQFSLPGPANGKGKGGNPYADLPEFCRVSLTLTPTNDSNIQVEVWLPASGWNGKYQAVGNGGWAGAITYGAMADALRRGYATSSTDTGHEGGRGIFAMEHPEQLIDYSYRAVHEMTLKAKALIEAFYESPARYSYWVGCSTGGRQGLTEAQRYPEDFDGIVAGAPANYFVHLHAWSIGVFQAVHATPNSFLEAEDRQVLKDGAMAQCDAQDGVEDGVIENPRACDFDPATVQCSASRTENCLNADQVAAARRIYASATNPRTGEEVFPGMEPGGETVWNVLGGAEPNNIPADTFRYVVFDDPEWDPMTLNFDQDIATSDEVAAGFGLNSIDPDLQPYFDGGGKLLMYHGWTDTLIAPGNSVNYYNSVANELGGVDEIRDSMRLFMAPGMNHCSGGDGPSSFDAVTLMEQWVEDGDAPDQMIATHPQSGRTRPLCQYPAVAVYDGSGSTDDAANFSCQVQ